MKKHIRLLLILLIIAIPRWAEAQITVNPSGVNVNHTGSTTIFLTFRGLAAGQVLEEAFWCGSVTANQCDAGTIFGRLPVRSDLSTTSGTSNVTDIMTIPASVARRAYQDALAGNASQFFYVRRFSNPAQFVAVTCRLAGGGARVPLSLLNVDLTFGNDKPVLEVARGSQPPPFSAKILYNGTGRLKGRWEVVLPSDTRPTQSDLLTEATLPLEERGKQRRYTQLSRFNVFLPPAGKVTIPGPPVNRLPQGTDGLHLILFRVEASDEKEGRSNVGTGNISTGGVAGFSMPVLRYYVGKASSEDLSSLIEKSSGLGLLMPGPSAILAAEQLVIFGWLEVQNSSLYRIEVANDEGSILSALVDKNISSYTAPTFLNDHQEPIRWRVEALGPTGVPFSQSAWRDLQIFVSEPELPEEIPADIELQIEPIEAPESTPESSN